jgi:aminobenzoyl-glutamate utilization protein B
MYCVKITLALLLFSHHVYSQENGKELVIQEIENQSESLIVISDQIWDFAETALKEVKSSSLLADYAEENGFRVTRGVADMPTAFIAEFGEGSPVIGVLGEYDALPGLSQEALPEKKSRYAGGAGHGCGHNLFGTASLGAAIAVKEWLKANKRTGTVRFYGTPAEEVVGGKLYMARAGLFDDLDACMDWHPDNKTRTGVQSSQAVIDYTISFHGKAAHGAYDPWNGRSALDAVEAFLHGVNLLREHVRPSVRIHYVISKGGDVPNVVPEEAEAWIWVRDSRMSGVLQVSERIKDIAEGAALIAGVKHKVRLNNGIYEILVNRTGGQLMQTNLETLGPIQYTEEEIAFAHAIQEATGKELTGMNAAIRPMDDTHKDPEGGSTDVGDVSWITPVIRLEAVTAPAETPWHAWPVVACGGMSIGHKGMLYASKALAMTMVDLYSYPDKLVEIRKEFDERKGDRKYQAMIPEGLPFHPSEK